MKSLKKCLRCSVVLTVVGLACGLALACPPYGEQFCTFVSPADDNSSEFWASSGILGEKAMNLRGRLANRLGSADPVSYDIEFWRCPIEDDPEIDEHWTSVDYKGGLITFTGEGGNGHWFWHPSTGTKNAILDGSGSAYFAIKVIVDKNTADEWYFWSGYAVLLDI